MQNYTSLFVICIPTVCMHPSVYKHVNSLGLRHVQNYELSPLVLYMPDIYLKSELHAGLISHYNYAVSTLPLSSFRGGPLRDHSHSEK